MGRAILTGVVFTLVLVGLVLGMAFIPSSAPPLRTYVAHTERDEYRVSAHEVVTEGFCSVFVRDGVRIAAVCGYHTWSETREE